MSDPLHDSTLAALERIEIPSNRSPDVRYRLSRVLDRGDVAATFGGERLTAEGACPVVIKLLRPPSLSSGAAARREAQSAILDLYRDALALATLAERVPPTPFVLRVVDAGTLSLTEPEGRVDVPWLVLEDIHGGAEGATLAERVAHAIRTTGYAFDPPRAARAVDALARGLAAMHSVGVIHRDVRPETILASGFGHDELVKLAEFAMARPSDLRADAGGFRFGQPGWGAPELCDSDDRRIGPATDVFGLGAVVFYMLTGEPLFQLATAGSAERFVRRRLADAASLPPDIGDRDSVLRAIEEAVAWATATRPEERPQTARALSTALLPWLRPDARRARLPARRLEAIAQAAPASPRFDFTVLHRARAERVVRAVAWSADGHGLAATDSGLAYWSGLAWRDAPVDGLPDPAGIRFVRRVAPGRWLVGGDRATFAVYTTEGVTEVVRGGDASVRFDLVSGDLDDIAVFVGVASDGAVALYALVGRRWLKPLPLDGVAALSSIARVGDDRWLLSGRTTDRAGFVGVYAPLEWAVERVETPPVRAFLRCAGHTDRRAGLATGAEGVLVWYDAGAPPRIETIDSGPDLSAAAVDATGRGWVASAGHIWTRDPASATWRLVWEEPAATTPIVAMFADVGRVVAMTAQGGVVDGRARMESASRP